MADRFLTVNCGSSSVKVALFQEQGSALQRLSAVNGTSLSTILDSLKAELKGLKGIGHRFVHGGAHYQSSVLLTPKVLDDLKQLNSLAPLHNPIALESIETTTRYFGQEVSQLAVFDTAFHRTIPPYAAEYAIPRALAKKYQIRRYGFHGIAHQSLWDGYSTLTGRSDGKVITLQLGNGCSMTAIRGGVSVDTSMGFTPSEGLIMGTRAGDIDAGAVDFLASHEGEVMDILDAQSGLLGISGITSDMKELRRSTQESATLAIEMFCYRIVKYLGAYSAVLQGVDAILFSGGIGENDDALRLRIVQAMAWMGLKLDEKANRQVSNLCPGTIHKISNEESSIEVYVMAADENHFIAKEVQKILLKQP